MPFRVCGQIWRHEKSLTHHIPVLKAEHPVSCCFVCVVFVTLMYSFALTSLCTCSCVFISEAKWNSGSEDLTSDSYTIHSVYLDTREGTGMNFAHSYGL